MFFFFFVCVIVYTILDNICLDLLTTRVISGRKLDIVGVFRKIFTEVYLTFLNNCENQLATEKKRTNLRKSVFD